MATVPGIGVEKVFCFVTLSEVDFKMFEIFEIWLGHFWGQLTLIKYARINEILNEFTTNFLNVIKLQIGLIVIAGLLINNLSVSLSKLTLLFSKSPLIIFPFDKFLKEGLS